MTAMIAKMKLQAETVAALSGRFAAALALMGALVFAGAPAEARPAPDSFADLAEHLSPAVVNISTTQTVSRGGGEDMPLPQFPPGSPFEDLFRDFMDKNQGGAPRKVTSLGSGFVIDPPASSSPTTMWSMARTTSP